MPSKRKFYKTIITVEVLSEDPRSFGGDLEFLNHAITEGDCSGHVTESPSEEVDGPTMAKLLEAQGSDSGFFMLDADGNDSDEQL